MKPITQTNLLLLLIAILLLGIVLRPIYTPQPVQAQGNEAYPYYLEPGTYMVRAPDGSTQTYAKVAVDLRDGKIWAFPTNGPQPFPINMVDPKPQTSHPILIGKFAFEDTNK